MYGARLNTVREDFYNQQQLEEAASLVERFLQSVRQGITNRRRTISTIQKLADELEKKQKDVNIAKCTGTVACIAGGSVAVAGGILSVLTLGLATPLVIAGIGTAVAGGVTKSGADITEAVFSKKTMTEAQKILDADKASIKDIDKCYVKLDAAAQRISVRNPMLGSKDKVLSALLIGSRLHCLNKDNAISKAVASSLFSTAGSAIKIVMKTQSRAGEFAGRLVGRVTSVFAKGVLEGTRLTVARAFGNIIGGAFLLFDIYQLVKVSKDIHNGSKSKVAQSLRDIANGFQKHLSEMQQFLEELETQVERLQEILNEEYQ